MLECTRSFILGGEQFSGAEAGRLRAKAQRQSEKYFAAFHRQNLEVLRNVFERETWHPLPPLTLHSLNLPALTGKGAAPPSHTLLLPASDGPPPDPLEGPTFAAVMAKGNPFRAEEKKAALVERKGVGEEEEEEEEREELLAEFIDEEGSSASEGNGTGGDVPVLTGSAVSVLRYMERYVRLMRLLQPVAAEVLKGLLHLFDLYLLSIFRLFGQREAIATPGSSEPPTPSQGGRGWRALSVCVSVWQCSPRGCAPRCCGSARGWRSTALRAARPPALPPLQPT